MKRMLFFLLFFNVIISSFIVFIFLHKIKTIDEYIELINVNRSINLELWGKSRYGKKERACLNESLETKKNPSICHDGVKIIKVEGGNIEQERKSIEFICKKLNIPILLQRNKYKQNGV